MRLNFDTALVQQLQVGQSNSPSENYLFLNVMVSFVIVNQKLTGSALHIEKNRTIMERKRNIYSGGKIGFV